jgi:Flp pilus assembly protein TadD
MRAHVLIAAALLCAGSIAIAENASVADRQVSEAKSLRIRGEYAAAEQRLNGVLQAQPDHFRATYNLGLAYSQSGRTDEAIQTLERAASLREKTNAQDFTIYNTLGYLYMRDGQYTAAEKQFLKGLQFKDKLSPSSRALLTNNLGTLYLSQGKADKAAPLFKEAASAGSASAKVNLDVASRVRK